MLNIPAERGVDDPCFQALLRLVGEGHAYAKLSAPYRLSTRFPDYPDARAFHDALLRANPERLLWGTDWPHPSIDATSCRMTVTSSICFINGRRTRERGS